MTFIITVHEYTLYMMISIPLLSHSPYIGAIVSCSVCVLISAAANELDVTSCVLCCACMRIVVLDAKKKGKTIQIADLIGGRGTLSSTPPRTPFKS